jgi:quinol monooxygenase YgiN
MQQKEMPRPSHIIPVEHPPFRRLRAYAFDPSLSTSLENAVMNMVTMQIRWEFDPETQEDILRTGPVGEYLEVVDFDPASDCFYAPVDLNQPYLLAQDGLAPSEGNPQFHQQMVYVVAMTTIRNFEHALGRLAFWAPHYSDESDGQGGQGGQAARKITETYVQRLRIYPHALREANAYYSPQKKALLLGYFPATSSDPRYHLPGGIVFTCLSHDVIAHETTHALLDGMHRRYEEASNPDVLAFHEAFADIVALFQHFSLPEVLRHQIAKTRGDLASENLLAQLAQEFGQATGSHGALRDALGDYDENGVWQRSTPDPTQIRQVFEPHARGSLLVAAIFDTFVSIYQSRVADLLRIATSGTGILPVGAVHPDLVNRLANEAAKSAQHILNMCIRALDYCPPVDLTFGDYLRALITADYDLVRDDDLGYRIAVVEAFRQHGIYPHDVRSLSIDSLRWQEPTDPDFHPRVLPMVQKLRGMIQEWDLTGKREQVYKVFSQARAELYDWLQDTAQEFQGLFGLDLSKPSATFEVHSLRPARRVGPDGQLLVELVIELTQQKSGYLDPAIQDQVDHKGMSSPPPADFIFRGGCTLLVDPITARVRYCITKNILSDGRLARQRSYTTGDTDNSLRAVYFGSVNQRGLKEPFAFLHRSLAGA